MKAEGVYLLSGVGEIKTESVEELEVLKDLDELEGSIGRMEPGPGISSVLVFDLFVDPKRQAVVESTHGAGVLLIVLLLLLGSPVTVCNPICKAGVKIGEHVGRRC